MTALFELSDLRVRLGEAEILRGVTATLNAGEFTAIVGPNGAGKTTLMSVLSGYRSEYSGSCLFDGREIGLWPKKGLAQRLAFIPQTLRLEFPFTAEQVVLMGRTPYCDGLFESPTDREAVRCALELTDATQFAGRDFRDLSGGEKQRVVLASALAQEPDVLLLDEPTTFLDIRHQLETYRLLQRLAGLGMSVVAVTHDLNLAAAYCGRIVALSHGLIAADGPPEEIVDAALIRRVFEAEVQVRTGGGERPWICYP